MKQESVCDFFFIFPKQGPKMESAVLNRVGILELYFVLNRGQGLRPSAVPLHPNMGQVPSTAPLNAVFGHRSRIYSITLLIVEAVCPFHVGGENESFEKPYVN